MQFNVNVMTCECELIQNVMIEYECKILYVMWYALLLLLGCNVYGM